MLNAPAGVSNVFNQNVWYFDTFHDLEKNGVVDGGGWVPEKSKTLNLHYN